MTELLMIDVGAFGLGLSGACSGCAVPSLSQGCRWFCEPLLINFQGMI
ncbi:MAG: hypothetical protein RQ723_07235 [Desulfuromonadales bacterium]|nr:hypothetical protein [Desulfuromonadales bacterium]